MSGILRTTLLLCIMMLVSVPSFATIPDPDNSIVPNVVHTPSGSAEYTVVVNNNAGAPLSGATVLVVFSGEADGLICWCTGQEHPIVEAITDVNGEATFNIAAGGCIDPAQVNSPPPVQVFANGTLIGEVGVVGPDAVDQTGTLPTAGWAPGGNCSSTLPDAVYFTIPISTNTYTFCTDFNSDGATGILDAVFITVPLSTGMTCTQQ